MEDKSSSSEQVGNVNIFAATPLGLIENYRTSGIKQVFEVFAKRGEGEVMVVLSEGKVWLKETYFQQSSSCLFSQYFHRHHYKHWNMQLVTLAEFLE